MEKLCYVMPRYEEEISSHYFYNYKFIESLGKKLNIFLVIESSEAEPEIENVERVYTRKFSRKYFPFNLIEMLLLFLFIRAMGYSKFYVHQSFGSAALSSLIVKIFGGKSYLWHCGIVQTKSIRPCIAFQLASYLVTGAESMREYYLKEFDLENQKVLIMPNWADLERFDPEKYSGKPLRRDLGVSDDQRKVLYIHGLSYSKGAHHIPSIAERVWENNPNTVFLVIGSGPLRNDLEVWEEKEGLGGKVRILGEVPNSEIPRYFKISDVFVMPSYQEGFPRVLEEAMATGVPFVGHDIGGVKDMLPLEYRERLVNLGDMEEFSDRVVELLEDKELREKLSEAGREYVRRYSKELVLGKFDEILGLNSLKMERTRS